MSELHRSEQGSDELLKTTCIEFINIMESTERYGLIVCGIGLVGIVSLIYRGTPLLSLQNISEFGYYPAVLGYVFYLLVFGVGCVLFRWRREATQESV